jgi:hypothetical protein
LIGSQALRYWCPDASIRRNPGDWDIMADPTWALRFYRAMKLTGATIEQENLSHGNLALVVNFAQRKVAFDIHMVRFSKLASLGFQ